MYIILYINYTPINNYKICLVQLRFRHSPIGANNKCNVILNQIYKYCNTFS